jgi:hypothetical protein
MLLFTHIYYIHNIPTNVTYKKLFKIRHINSCKMGVNNNIVCMDFTLWFRVIFIKFACLCMENA